MQYTGIKVIRRGKKTLRKRAFYLFYFIFLPISYGNVLFPRAIDVYHI